MGTMLTELHVSVLFPLSAFGLTIRALNPKHGARAHSQGVRDEIVAGSILVDERGRERTNLGERINAIFDLPARTIYLARMEKGVVYHELGRAVQYMLGYNGTPGKMRVSESFLTAYERGEAVSPYAQRSPTSAFAQAFATYFGACRDTFGGDVTDRRHGWAVLEEFAPKTGLHLHETAIMLDGAYHIAMKQHLVTEKKLRPTLGIQ